MTKSTISLLLALTTVATTTRAQTSVHADERAQQGTTNSDSGIEILTKLTPSDQATMQKSYLPGLTRRVGQAWLPLIPNQARPPQLKQGIVAIVFHVAADGKISQMRLSSPSGEVGMDRAAWGAIVSVSPYLPFPSGMQATEVDLCFNFRYNTK